ncbi:Sodium:dicarboxylate symporter [Clathrospora elynae]|uniref:Amino acid transporter n=1 Tax=Clathrospora elynae TaxID=706981 RepID=A0A6A5SRM0_9PLEO|nr:Sodium:dicarboxylate symporter [Clathrospora elynae]
MSEIEQVKHGEAVQTSSPTSSPSEFLPQPTVAVEEKKSFFQRVKEPDSVWQIIIAALLAIVIGLAVTTQVDEVLEAAIAILATPGNMWLHALRAVVLPMIVTAMIMAIQRLRNMTQGGCKAGQLARWTIGYYVITTVIAVAHSCLLVGLVWSRLMNVVSGDALEVSADDQETIDERQKVAIHDVVVDMFYSLVPQNVFNALAIDALLSVPGGALMRAVGEVEAVVLTIITVLIQLAPIGVFFLIMPNLFRLHIAEIGMSLGILIGGTLVGMIIHLFIIIPIIFFAITRKIPYAFWLGMSPAWITAWGTASSAATLPVTIRCVLKEGIPIKITKFAVPLGCLINMDGTAIYFLIVVVFLAATQGITLNAADYIVVILLSTLASIGTTPIPISSLVLVVMIAGSVGIPITGMYAVVVAIDWFLDRFRTAVNVSADTFAAAIVTKITGIVDEEGQTYEEAENADPNALGRRDDEKV